jgi:lysophospholipid acyltransferase (LPLAT)-like uncharacterized protein
MAMKNTRVTRILGLCLSMVVWLIGFSLNKEEKWGKNWYKEIKNENIWEVEPLVLTFWP